MIHYTYLGVSFYKFQNNIVFLSEDPVFTLTNNLDSDEIAKYFGISSGSSLFVKDGSSWGFLNYYFGLAVWV